MGGEFPAWIGGGEGSACPPDLVCSQGTAVGLDSQSEALAAARNAAMSELVSGVVVKLSGTTEVFQEESYAGNEVKEKGHVRQRVESQVRGRLRNTRVLNKFWQKRVEHSRQGRVFKFDGWVVVGVPKAVLDSAYQEEQLRAKTVSKRVEDQLKKQISDLRGAGAPNPVGAISLYGRSITELDDLIDGGAAARPQVDELLRLLTDRLAAKLFEHQHATGASESEGVVLVTFDGQAVAGLTVFAKSTCLGSPSVSKTTDERGMLALSLKHPSRFEDCEVLLELGGQPLLAKGIVVRSEFDGAELVAEVQVSGYGSQTVESRLSKLEADLVAAHPILRSSQESTAARTAVLVLEVEASTQSPSRLGGSLLRGHGSVLVRLRLRGSSVATLLEERSSIVGIGANGSQVATSFAENIKKLAAEVLAKGLGEM